jgi:hypothetical protein
VDDIGIFCRQAGSQTPIGGSFGDAVVGPATLSNTILANSAAAGHCSGTITDGGHNIQKTKAVEVAAAIKSLLE